MGYGTDQEGGGGDWKGGHMRIDSHEPEPPSASSADSAKGADDIELRDRDDKAHQVAGGGRRRPNAFNDDEDDDEEEEGGPPSRDEANGVVAFQFYKVYKRRWFGLVQLTLLNIIVSWDVSVQGFLNFYFRCRVAFSCCRRVPGFKQDQD